MVEPAAGTLVATFHIINDKMQGHVLVIILIGAAKLQQYVVSGIGSLGILVRLQNGLHVGVKALVLYIGVIDIPLSGGEKIIVMGKISPGHHTTLDRIVTFLLEK